jgi:uncharacterized protein YjaZ
MNDHVKALFEGQELSEDFKQKASAIIESMLSEKEAEIRESIVGEQTTLFESQVEEKTSELESLSEAYVTEEVLPTISKYLTAAVNEWQEENAIAIESGVKVELAESFLKGFVGLAEAHNLSVPEGSDSIVEKTQKDFEQVKSKLDSLTEKNVELKEALDEQTRSIVIARVCSDLTESQKEKFTTYSESMQFKTQDQFESAVSQLKESYFPKTGDKKVEEDEQEKVLESENLTEKDETRESAWLKTFVGRL